MSLKDQITADMKSAMRAGEKEKLATIRLIQAAIKQREVDERIELDDTQVLSVLEKMLKQRRDSVSQFAAAGRQDLVDKEQAEISVIEVYMPQPLSEAELAEILAACVSEAGATSARDMGKVMSLLKPRVAGRADMQALAGKVKAALGG
ncbi:MAG: GatB/YqeY domain-containing protein [Xanthomonadales bacterium]|nr:GatB/YqeY domain-containing protein [Xanthomonadales bacterium]MCB1633911.1 GatB/YqeY domain-containing protein [Xanthomonadales bacterium]MCB1642948.1 GatB/YqeY domain-containing protein [Xanthomonadales bacterium]